MAYYGDETPGFHLPFNFHLIKTPWEPQAIAALIEQYERALARRPRALAELGAGQSRPLARREPHRSRAGARRRDAAADLARHADDLSGRGDRHGGRADPDAGGARSVGEERARASASDAIPSARRCNGTTARRPASPAASRGCRSQAIMRPSTCGSSAREARSMLSLYRALIALRRREPALSVGVLVKAEAIGIGADLPALSCRALARGRAQLQRCSRRCSRTATTRTTC